MRPYEKHDSEMIRPGLSQVVSTVIEAPGLERGRKVDDYPTVWLSRAL